MLGKQGYLVTISSQAENDFITTSLGGSSAWIGASDAAAEGEWRWVTDLTDGSQFWEGTKNGVSINSAFCNWDSRWQPDNLGNQDYAYLLGGLGIWDDVNSNDGYPEAYVIEYVIPEELLDGTYQGIVFEGAAQLNASGNIRFADADLIDTHTVAVVADSGATGVLDAELTQDATGGTEGVVSWTYDGNAEFINSLAEGEQVTETFTLNITDNNGGVATTDINVLLIGTNDSPTDFLLSADNVVENSAGGVKIADLIAVDPDRVDSFTFAIVDDPSGFFAIIGSQLVVADGAQIDYETATSHDLVIEVTDAAGASFQKSVTIYVEDVAGVTILGSAGADTINGVSTVAGQPKPTSEADTIDGRGGNDLIDGLAGNDVILGGTGDDTIYGGLGADRIDGGVGVDKIYGGAGDDVIVVRGTEAQADTMEAGEVAEVYGDTLFVDGTIALTLNNFNASASGIENWQGNDLGLLGTTANNLFDLSGLISLSGLTYVDGSSGNDTLIGSIFADDLRGGSGNDTLNGNDGDDTFDGSVGSDTLLGGKGDDTFIIRGVEATNDTFDGGEGIDRIVIEGASSVTLNNFDTTTSSIEGWLGNGQSILGTTSTTQGDRIDLSNLSSLSGLSYVDGQDGNDVIVGSQFNDDLRGGAGNDSLTGGSGNDALNGGAGIDTIYGGSGDDVIFVTGTEALSDIIDAGEAGESVGDTLRVTGTANLTLQNFGSTTNGIEIWLGNNAALLGDAGSDVFDFSALTSVTGLTYVDGSSGNDTLIGSSFNDDLRGGAGADNLFGGFGSDQLTGGAGADTMDGGEGSDIYIIASTTDFVGDLIHDTGNTGIDQLRYAASTASTLTLSSQVTGIEEIVLGTGTGGTAVTTGTTAINVNASALTTAVSITGNNGANNLTGGSGDDILMGNAGSDRLVGGSGSDWLYGGFSNDILTGGTGADMFVFDTMRNTTSNIDRITDFNVSDDTIGLENAVFTALGLTTGALSAAAFRIGTAAGDADDRIIYNSATGALFYDSNGNVAGGSMQIATLSTGLALTNNDFWIL